jgi:hypothetical protein
MSADNIIHFPGRYYVKDVYDGVSVTLRSSIVPAGTMTMTTAGWLRTA